MNIDGYEMDKNDEMDQNSSDQVKTNQMFVFDRTNKRKDFQSGFNSCAFFCQLTDKRVKIDDNTHKLG